MADFQLSAGTDTFDFDIAGNVSQSGTQSERGPSTPTTPSAFPARPAAPRVSRWTGDSMPRTNSNCANPA